MNLQHVLAVLAAKAVVAFLLTALGKSPSDMQARWAAAHPRADRAHLASKPSDVGTLGRAPTTPTT